MNAISTSLSAIGGIVLVTLFIRISIFTYTYIRRPSMRRYLRPDAGETWAIVTGASDGIGHACAAELARTGFNVVLHGRNAAKLRHVRVGLEKSFPRRQFGLLVVDAAKAGPEANRELEIALKDLNGKHVTVLVNNVGSAVKSTGAIMQPFMSDTPEEIDLLVNINARFPAQFTRAVLPLLTGHGEASLILTLGSVAAYGMPYLVTYSATKSFNLAFSSALKRELQAEAKNIEVLGIMLAEVTDVAGNKSAPSLFMPDSKTFARALLDRIGCDKDIVAPYFPHAILWTVICLIPNAFFGKLVIKSATAAKAKPEMVAERSAKGIERIKEA